MHLPIPKGEQVDQQESREIPWTNFHRPLLENWCTDCPMWSNSVISRQEEKLRAETCHRDDSTLKKDKMVGDGGICSRWWELGGRRSKRLKLIYPMLGLKCLWEALNSPSKSNSSHLYIQPVPVIRPACEAKSICFISEIPGERERVCVCECTICPQSSF